MAEDIAGLLGSSGSFFHPYPHSIPAQLGDNVLRGWTPPTYQNPRLCARDCPAGLIRRVCSFFHHSPPLS